jgi:triphosphoribosyl-dephospho-CoA synthase
MPEFSVPVPSPLAIEETNEEMVAGWGSADQPRRLADLAVESLIAEAMLTPKPGLVDRRGSGAHRDLDLRILVRSARALHAPLACMARAASGRVPSQALREELAAIGRDGERRMLLATDGSNSHRGAQWVLGLLVAGRAMAGSAAAPVTAGELAALAGAVARFSDRFAPPLDSHGAQVARLYGAAGARGEAACGFPHVLNIGLPALAAARRRGLGESAAQLDALVAIMARLDDTCLLHRGGLPALDAAQRGAGAVLAAGGASTPAGRRAYARLEVDLLARNLSPGGSADLLAACLFLERTSVCGEERARERASAGHRSGAPRPRSCVAGNPHCAGE